MIFDLIGAVLDYTRSMKGLYIVLGRLDNYATYIHTLTVRDNKGGMDTNCLTRSWIEPGFCRSIPFFLQALDIGTEWGYKVVHFHPRHRDNVQHRHKSAITKTVESGTNRKEYVGCLLLHQRLRTGDWWGWAETFSSTLQRVHHITNVADHQPNSVRQIATSTSDKSAFPHYLTSHETLPPPSPQVKEEYNNHRPSHVASLLCMATIRCQSTSQLMLWFYLSHVNADEIVVNDVTQ